MGEMIRLTAKDGFEFDAYVAAPAGTPRGAIVVVQEIFGVNPHIRSVADRYAAEGYMAIAPALFDRITPGFTTGYTGEDRAKAMAMMGAVKAETAQIDIQAAIDHVAPAGKVGIVGFCWGGSMSWQAAGGLEGLAASVGYYGHGVLYAPDLKLKCPAMLHFGALDAHIPVDKVEALQKSRSDVPVYIYDADHGFNCDARSSYDAAAAELARERTLAFFGQHVAG